MFIDAKERALLAKNPLKKNYYPDLQWAAGLTNEQLTTIRTHLANIDRVETIRRIRGSSKKRINDVPLFRPVLSGTGDSSIKFVCNYTREQLGEELKRLRGEKQARDRGWQPHRTNAGHNFYNFDSLAKRVQAAHDASDRFRIYAIHPHQDKAKLRPAVPVMYMLEGFVPPTSRYDRDGFCTDLALYMWQSYTDRKTDKLSDTKGWIVNKAGSTTAKVDWAEYDRANALTFLKDHQSHVLICADDRNAKDLFQEARKS